MVKYLGERNVGIFSTDWDSFDFKMRKPEQVVKSVMDRLNKHGKGIILMHDFQHATSEAVPEILKQLKAGGFKIVQVVGKTPVEPMPEYKDDRAQGDGRRARRGAPDVERHPDDPGQLTHLTRIKPAARAIARPVFSCGKAAASAAGAKEIYGSEARSLRACSWQKPAA